MSLASLLVALSPLSFPRVSGDEPTTADAEELQAWFSPRERG